MAWDHVRHGTGIHQKVLEWRKGPTFYKIMLNGRFDERTPFIDRFRDSGRVPNVGVFSKTPTPPPPPPPPFPLPRNDPVIPMRAHGGSRAAALPSLSPLTTPYKDSTLHTLAFSHWRPPVVNLSRVATLRSSILSTSPLLCRCSPQSYQGRPQPNIFLVEFTPNMVWEK